MSTQKSSQPENDSPQGKIIILVAPSGSGKTTLAKKLFHKFPELKFSVSATTRPPRKHEVPGIDYHFLSPDAFDEAIAKGEFLEWEEFYGGIKYGTLVSEVEKELKKGYFVLLDIEVKGAFNVKERFGKDALAIFIRPPSDTVLLERLKKRGTENEVSLMMRLDRARMELSFADKFDQVIVNDDLEVAGRELSDIVASFMNKTSTN